MELTANGGSAAGGGGEREDTNFLTPLAAALHSVSTTCLASDRNPLRPVSLIPRSPSASCLPTTTDAAMLSLPNGVIPSTNTEPLPVNTSTSPAHQNGGIPAGTGDGSSTAALTQPSALVPTIMVTPATMETPPGTPVHTTQNKLFQAPTLTPHGHHPLNKAEENDLRSAARSHSRLMQKREDCYETAV